MLSVESQTFSEHSSSLPDVIFMATIAYDDIYNIMAGAVQVVLNYKSLRTRAGVQSNYSASN